MDHVKIKFYGLQVHLKAYYYILSALGVAGYRDDQLGNSGAIDYGKGHFTCFQFGYDWRRDIVESAKELNKFILKQRKYVQREIESRYGIKDQDVRFDIVAHSMGGLVVRYYLRYGIQDLPVDGSLPELTWHGARYIENVILIATPNAGAVEALIDLVYGKKLAAFLPRYEPAILGTMPSVYQLLPRGRHGVLVDAKDPKNYIDSIYDPEFWQRMQWGLADPGQDKILMMLMPDVDDADQRRKIAFDHLAKSLRRAEQFTAALDIPASPPANVALHLIAGDAVPTDKALAVDARTGALEVIETAPGDGTVLRSSALMDERMGGNQLTYLQTPIEWTRVQYIFNDHLGLTRDPAFTDNVLFILLENPR